MLNCLLSLDGISFLPPPGWIIAEIREMSTMCVKSPAGFVGFRFTMMKVELRNLFYENDHHARNCNLTSEIQQILDRGSGKI